MIIDSKFKLEKAMASASDPSRPAIREASVCKSPDGRIVAVATNGHILACVPVDASADECGPLSAEALKAYRKVGGTLNVSGGDYRLDNGVSMPRTSTAKQNFPQWEQITESALRRPVHVKILLDPKLLLALHEAIGRDERGRVGALVQLEISDDPNDPIVLRTNNNHEAFGLIMPGRMYT